MTPALAGAADGTYTYRAESTDLSQWEIGIGTLSSSGTVFSRDTVYYNSSNSGVATGQSGAGTKINFTVAPQVGLIQMVHDTLCPDQATAWTYLQKAQARANIDALKYNYIINGAMMVSQENGTTALTGAGSYPVDQFLLDFATSGTLSIAQVASATPGGSPNRLRVTVTAADASVAAGDIVYLSTKIEGLRVADLLLGSASPKTFTVQFGVKAPAGTYCVVASNGGAGGTRSYVAEYVISGGEANTDVVKSVTIAGDTTGTWPKDNTAGLVLRWGLMAGSTFQQAAGSWGTVNAIGSSSQFNLMGTNGNVFELFDVSMTEGSAAPVFQVPDFTTELLKCQRYWEKSYDYATAVAATVTPGSETSTLVMSSATVSQGGSTVSFKVPKRATPTVTAYSPTTGASGKMRDVQNVVDVNANIDYVGQRSCRIYSSAITASSVLALIVHWKSDARL